MTCIVGLVDRGVVYIGGDSLGVGDLSKHIRKDTKVFKRGEFVIGFTTSFRMGQVLMYSLNPPKHHDEVEDHEYMVTSFINAVRECLKSAGYAKKENEVESAGRFLVGYRGNLYSIDSDYQVGIVADNYAAVGCGEDLALGAMYAQDPSLSPITRMRKALEAAEHFSVGVGAPFHFVRSDGGAA